MPYLGAERGPDQVMAVHTVTLTKEFAILRLAIKIVSDTMVTLLENASAELDSLKRSERKCNAEVKFVHQDLVKVAEKVITYINKVENLALYGHEQTDNLIARVKLASVKSAGAGHPSLFSWLLGSAPEPDYESEPDYEPLNDFLYHLKCFLTQMEELYQKFEEAIGNANTSSIRAAEDCKAQKNQISTMANGFLIGAVVVATAAVLTGGPGFLIGLPAGAAIAGGCAAVVTAGAAQVTYNIVRDLQNSENMFKKLSRNLDCLAQRASDMRKSARQVQGTLEVLAISVEPSLGEHKNPESLRCSLDILHKMFGELFEVMSKFHAAVAIATKTLKELGSCIN